MEHDGLSWDDADALVWLGQTTDAEPPPPLLTAEQARNGSWTPGEKIMLAMLMVNVLWFGWTIAVSPSGG